MNEASTGSGSTTVASESYSVEIGRHIWLNGELVRTGDAQLSVLDHGITVGDGTFEAIPVVRGRAFALTRHLARLRGTLDVLGIELVRDDRQLASAINEVIIANDPANALVRLTVTAGVCTLGTARSGSNPTVIIGSTAAIARTPTTSVVAAPWCRNERSSVSGLKTTSYIENVLASKYALQHSASEVLLANTRGELCEGGGSNIFVVIDGELLTPPLTSGCLPGVTRQLVLEGFPAREEVLQFGDLIRASEAFLTASTRDIQPIHSIDAVALTAPGRVTSKVQLFFAELREHFEDP